MKGLTLELLARDMITLQENLDITEEKARFAIAGNQDNAGQLMAFRAILTVLLKRDPTVLPAARAWIAATFPLDVHAPVRAAALSMIANLAKDLG